MNFVSKIILTGSTGFIGSHLKKHFLSHQIQVQEIFRDFSDLQMHQVFTDFKPDLVIHLAGYYSSEHSLDDLYKIIDANILFSSRVLDAMSKSDCRCFLNTGSMWQNQNGAPVNLYAASKSAFEEILSYYVRQKNINVLTLKLADTYGPGDERKKIIPLLLKSLKTKNKIALTPGDQRSEWIYIDDILNAFLLAANMLKSQYSDKSQINSYTLCSGQQFSIKEIVHLIEKISHGKLNVEFGAIAYRKNQVMQLQIEDPLLPDWVPRINLEQGLSKLINS